MHHLDYLAERSSLIVSWAPGGTVEIARRWPSGGAAALSGGVTLGSSAAAIPDPAQQDTLYQQLVAPELSLYASPVTATAIGLTLSYPLAGGRDAWVTITRSRLTIRGTAVTMSPIGDRAVLRVMLGVALR
jgi:hypothetical protein